MLISNEVAGLIDFVLTISEENFMTSNLVYFLGGNLFHEIAINVRKG